MKIIGIVGLPGSGKTYLAHQMMKNNSYNLIDDFSINSEVNTNLLVQEFLHDNKDLIIIDVNFCKPNVRSSVEHFFSFTKGISISWIFFENNPDKCLNNVKYRNSLGDERKVELTIKDLSKQYKIPDGILPKEIWNKKC